MVWGSVTSVMSMFTAAMWVSTRGDKEEKTKKQRKKKKKKRQRCHPRKRLTARPPLVPSLKVRNPLKTCRLLFIIDNVDAAVGDTTPRPRPRRARRPVDGRIGAKVLGYPALAPDVAADIQGARVKVGELGPVRGRLRPRHLRAADGVVDGRRHGGLSLAHADEHAVLQLAAVGEAPGLFLVEPLNVAGVQGVLPLQPVASVVRFDGVGGARSVRVRLRSEVRLLPLRTADNGLWFEVAAEGLAAAVELGELADADPLGAAILRNAVARVARLDLDVLASAVRVGGWVEVWKSSGRAAHVVAGCDGAADPVAAAVELVKVLQ
jgi:hypothetical protein